MRAHFFAMRAGGVVSVGILLSAHTSTAQSYVVDPRPMRTLEGTAPDGTPVFGRVAGATRLANGMIVVGDGSANALKYFDGQGRLTQAVGRQGQGPGEFTLLQWVRQCAQDSLFAYDMMPRRTSVFSASGRFVRQFQTPEMSGMVACSRYGVLAVLSGQRATQPPAGVTLWRVTAPLLISDARGTVTRDLGSVLAYDIALAGRGWLPRPGGAVASIAVGRDRVVVCPTDSGDVGVYSLAGARLRSIPLQVPPRAPSRRDLERSADAQLVLMPAGAFRDNLRQRLLRVPAPAHLPPCSKILMDPSDNVWVVLSAPGDSVTRLRVFGRDGRVLGDVTLPAELEVLEIGSDYLLASGESADGEPWVRMYRVRRTAP